MEKMKTCKNAILKGIMAFAIVISVFLVAPLQTTPVVEAAGFTPPDALSYGNWMKEPWHIPSNDRYMVFCLNSWFYKAVYTGDSQGRNSAGYYDIPIEEAQLALSNYRVKNMACHSKHGYGSTMTLGSNITSSKRPGYTLVGWSENPNASLSSTSNGFYHDASGWHAAGAGNYLYGQTISLSRYTAGKANVLYAIWCPLDSDNYTSETGVSTLVVKMNHGTIGGNSSKVYKSTLLPGRTAYTPDYAIDSNCTSDPYNFNTATVTIRESDLNAGGSSMPTLNFVTPSNANPVASMHPSSTYWAGATLTGEGGGDLALSTVSSEGVTKIKSATYTYNSQHGTDNLAITIEYMPITLPEATLKQANTVEGGTEIFIGWYLDPDYKKFAGAPGSLYYIPDGVTTLYARFDSIHFKTLPVYFQKTKYTGGTINGLADADKFFTNVILNADGTAKNDYAAPYHSLAVNYGKGATNLQAYITGANAIPYYWQFQYKLAASSSWSSNLDSYDSVGSTGLVGDLTTGIHNSGKYYIPTAGIYTFDLRGARGYDWGANDYTGPAYGGNGAQLTGLQLELPGGCYVQFSAGGGTHSAATLYYRAPGSATWQRIACAAGGADAMKAGDNNAYRSEYAYDDWGGKKDGQSAKLGESTANGAFSCNWHRGEKFHDDWYHSYHSTNKEGGAPDGASTNGTYGEHWEGTNSEGNYIGYNVLYKAPSAGASKFNIPASINVVSTGSWSYSGSYSSQIYVKFIGKYRYSDGTSIAQLIAAKTPDTTAPDKTTVTIDKNWFTYADVSWTQPDPGATAYDFRALLYRNQVHSLTSSVYREFISSQFAGYYYRITNSRLSSVSGIGSTTYKWSNLTGTVTSDPYSGWVWTTTPQITVKKKNYTTYLNIISVDAAGNLSPIQTVTLDYKGNKKDDGGPGTEIDKIWDNLMLVTFDTNRLAYQLSPETTVTYTNIPWTPTSTVPATDENVQDYYVQRYYAVNGSNIYNGTGAFMPETGNDLKEAIAVPSDYGGAFPTVSARGCTFLGWNDKDNGTGTWYSQNGTGDKSGKDKDNTAVLVVDATAEKCGQAITLYAIYSDNTKISTSVTYNAPDLTTVGIAGDASTATEVTMNVHSSTASKFTTPWSHDVVVGATGTGAGTGIDYITQVLSNQSNAKRSEISKDMAGETTSNVASLTNPDYTSNTFETKTINDVNPHTTHLNNHSLYTPNPVTFDVNYNYQGTYFVDAYTSERELQVLNSIHGYPAYAETTDMAYTVKIDKTKPVMTKYKITQDRLSNYKSDDIATAIQNGLYTTFVISASDYNNSANGVYDKKGDSSGIYGVYIRVWDADNTNSCKIYSIPLEDTAYGSVTARTDNPDKNILAGTWTYPINLYTEFPDASKVIYEVYVVDNAGNVSNKIGTAVKDYTDPTDPDYPGDPDGPDPDLPDDNPKTDEGDDVYPHGLLTNFSIKTIIYSDKDDEFNIDDMMTIEDMTDLCAFFQTGDFGHVDIWTIGYVSSVDLDFLEIGQEGVKEILAGNLPEKYNMGVSSTYNANFTRMISYTKSKQLLPEFLKVYDKDTQKIVTLNKGTAKYNALMKNSSGAYYAQYYTFDKDTDSEKWLSEGTQVRIPPYYQMKNPYDRSEKTHADGTTAYHWETHSYIAGAYKNSDICQASWNYIIYDEGANDLHFRVIHEN
jgi:hypothetical protein